MQYRNQSPGAQVTYLLDKDVRTYSVVTTTGVC